MTNLARACSGAPLNIGAFISSYGTGGSHNSAATLCNALARRGHNVTFYYPVEHSLLHVRPNVPVVDLPLDRWAHHVVYNVTRRNRATAMREARERRHDVLIAFTWPSLLIAGAIGAALRIPCWYYKLGPGWFPPRGLHSGPFIANCEETRDQLVAYTELAPQDIAIVRGRVNVERLLASAATASSFGADGPEHETYRIGMMSRLERSKQNGIRYVLQAVEDLARRRSDFGFMLAGDGVLRDAITKDAAALNERIGRDVVRVIGHVNEVGAFLARNDINIGIGRCAFESMALGKPTLVVGNMGFAGAVEPRTLDELAYYNISGRNIVSEAALPPQALADRIDAILASSTEREALGTFALSAFQRMFSDERGAIDLEACLLNAHCVQQGTGGTSRLAAIIRSDAFFLRWRTRMLAYSLKRRFVAPEEHRTAREQLSRIESCVRNAERTWKERDA